MFTCSCVILASNHRRPVSHVFLRVWPSHQKRAIGGGDVVQQLNRSLEEASSSLQQLGQQRWLDYR